MEAHSTRHGRPTLAAALGPSGHACSMGTPASDTTAPHATPQHHTSRDAPMLVRLPPSWFFTEVHPERKMGVGS